MQTFKFYHGRGIFKEYANLDEMCGCEGVDADAMKATFRSYNAEHEGVKDVFGKTHFPIQSFDPFAKVWVAKVTPVIHYSMGGIKINEHAAVQTNENYSGLVKFRNLYAAGECTGGVHGGDRLAGNSLLDCVVYGRTAGKSAAAAVASASASNSASVSASVTRGGAGGGGGGEGGEAAADGMLPDDDIKIQL